LEAQAILRVMERSLNERSALWRDASMTIIDVGGHNTHMYVVQNQRLQFIRGVKFGSELFVRAVSSGMEISLPEAEQVLNDPLTRLDSEGTLISAHGDEIKRTVLEADLQKLTREFLRLLRYFRSLHPERSYAGILDHVMISGGLVGLQGFGEYLEQTLGLRVERARPIAGMTAKVNPEAFQRIASRQEAFTVVMGLALSGICRKSGSVGDEYAGNEFAWTRAS
jgi:Tfp pilus assembly PilM family ATPase